MALQSNYLDWREQIPVQESYDVIVAGGGLSGVAAALSAARMGRKVLLLERSAMLGGLATQGLVNLWVPLCNGRGRQIIKGMAEELLRLSIRYGFDTLPEEWRNGEPAQPTKVRYTTNFSIGIFALSLLEILKENQVTLCYDAVASQPVMEKGHCRGVIVQSKSGRGFYPCSVVVDATGDADLLARAQVPCFVGGNYFTTYGEGIDVEHCREVARTGKIHDAYYWMMGGTANLYGKNHPEGMPLFHGTTLEGVNEFLQTNQQALLDGLKAQDRNKRDLHLLPGMAQMRTTRCIEGNHTLTTADQYRHFSDSVGAICDFDQRDVLYEVPYGTLYHPAFDNFLTCGRSASAQGYAWDVLRVIPPAVLTGQAAGVAAALAAEGGVGTPEVDVGKLQERLTQTGVIIHFEDGWVPTQPKEDSDAHMESHL
ncbi:MAG: FAD-dependent oxidoreductase [Eubacteriales bacterium]|nr:FAD-dependent oxidoreductase [Eubacteriales bacterium]